MPSRIARQRRPWIRRAGAVAVIAGVFGLATWSFTGPLGPGWASGPKHPSSVLATSPTPPAPKGASADPNTSSTGVPPLPFDAVLTGALTQTGTDNSGQVAITIDTRVSGSMTGRLTVVLRGQAAGSGVALASSSVTFGPSGAPTAYHGQVVLLNGDQLVASVVDSAGSRINLGVLLQIDPMTGSVKGSLQCGPGQATRAGDGDTDGGR